LQGSLLVFKLWLVNIYICHWHDHAI
jgi:hypothetical protein